MGCISTKRKDSVCNLNGLHSFRLESDNSPDKSFGSRSLGLGSTPGASVGSFPQIQCTDDYIQVSITRQISHGSMESQELLKTCQVHNNASPRRRSSRSSLLLAPPDRFPPNANRTRRLSAPIGLNPILNPTGILLSAMRGMPYEFALSPCLQPGKRGTSLSSNQLAQAPQEFSGDGFRRRQSMHAWHSSAADITAIEQRVRKAKHAMKLVSVIDGKLYIDYQYVAMVPPGMKIKI